MSTHELAVVGLVGSGIGTALGAPMAWPRPERAWDARLLGAVLLLASALVALISARLAGLLPEKEAVEHAINLLGLTALPLVVVYTGRATAVHGTTRSMSLLWAPAGAYLAVLVARAGLGQDTRVPFAWLLPVVLAFTLLSALPLVRGPRGSAVLVPPAWLVGFLVVLNAAQIARMAFGHVAPVRAIVPLVLSSGFVALVSFVAWRTVCSTSAARPAGAARYQRSGLDAAGAAEFLARIDAALNRDRLFARQELTLAQLATAAGCTPHQLSESLNRYAGTSFRDLLQRRRVDDVKAQLLEGDSDRFTIEGIGASAGFRSRSALYTAFRRLEGMTPVECRESLRRRHESGPR